jgi:hypothetical protein
MRATVETVHIQGVGCHRRGCPSLADRHTVPSCNRSPNSVALLKLLRGVVCEGKDGSWQCMGIFASLRLRERHNDQCGCKTDK